MLQLHATYWTKVGPLGGILTPPRITFGVLTEASRAQSVWGPGRRSWTTYGEPAHVDLEVERSSLTKPPLYLR